MRCKYIGWFQKFLKNYCESYLNRDRNIPCTTCEVDGGEVCGYRRELEEQKELRRVQRARDIVSHAVD